MDFEYICPHCKKHFTDVEFILRNSIYQWFQCSVCYNLSNITDSKNWTGGVVGV